MSELNWCMIRGALAGLALIVCGAVSGQAEPAAKTLFSAVAGPSQDRGGPHAIGSYAKGCLAGAVALPMSGQGWQILRPSRNRGWGTPELIGWLEQQIGANRAAGRAGLLIGDIAQPRGGPMSSGHASHEIGLDADIWLSPFDRSFVPESVEPPSMIDSRTRQVDPARFGAWQAAVIRQAAMSPAVDRIFVAPGIKRAMCERYPGADWLRRLRPWFGHDSHFHVRLSCPAGETACVPQAPPPPGDGCGAELASWFLPPPPPPKVRQPPAPPVTLADLPAACAVVLREP